jgi:preprotein translocase subunit YajC
MKNIFTSLLILLSSSALAQEGAGGQTPGLANFVPIVAIFIIIYFLMIRPQKKQLEEEKAMLGGLNKGDEIYTKAGILGTIVGMTDKVITLEVAENTKLKVLRSQVGGLSSKLFEKKKEEKKA